MTQPKHALYGGSKADIYMNCAGSVALWATVPNPPPSTYAMEGTLAHALGEYCLLHDIDDAYAVVDNRKAHRIELSEELAHYEARNPMTREMADAVNVYLEVVASLRKVDPNAQIMLEQKVAPLAALAETAYGSVDCAAYMPKEKRLVVIDYKHGAGMGVSVEENPQLLFYAAGALNALGKQPVKIVDIIVVQPRLYGSEPVKRWRTDRARVEQFQNELNLAILATYNEDAERNPGSWCKWCKAAGVCPERAGAAFDGLAEANVPVTIDDAFVGVAQAHGKLPAPASLEPWQLGKILDVEDAFTAWFKEVRDTAFNLLHAGQEVPGYKLVEKDSRRKWADADPEAIGAYLSLTYGVPDEDLFPRKLATITDVERALKAAVPNKDMLKEAKDDLTLNFTVKQSSGLTLAPQSDRREAASPMNVTAALQGVDL